MTKKVEICSTALMLLGHKPISSLDEPGAGALLSKNLYKTTYLSFLSSNNWNFNKKYSTLNRLTETPDHPNYDFQYQLPIDYVRISTTMPQSDYKIFEDKIYSNEHDLGIEYYYSVKEEVLPPYAIRCMEYLMASTLSIPLTVDTQKAGLYQGLYQKQLVLAMSIDSQNAPVEGFYDSPITSVRFG